VYSSQNPDTTIVAILLSELKPGDLDTISDSVGWEVGERRAVA
jgi:hypothetical protein